MKEKVHVLIREWVHVGIREIWEVFKSEHACIRTRDALNVSCEDTVRFVMQTMTLNTSTR